MTIHRISQSELQFSSGRDDDPLVTVGAGVGSEPRVDDHSVGILIVDDNGDNLIALKAVLEPLGERLICAESGEQALRVLLREEVALILLDVRMAGLDGLETARIIRSRPATRRIPIIFLTAHASEVDEIAMAYASGAVDYVIKPFEPEILRAKVSVFVELSRERTERVRQSQARAEAEAVARTIRALQILSDTALAHLDLDELAAELLERSATLFEADAAALLLLDEHDSGLYVKAKRGSALDALPADALSLGRGTLGQLAVERRSALLRGTDLAPLQTVHEQHRALASLLVVPLVAADQLLGLLLLSAAEDRFERRHLDLLTLAADRMAIAVDHVQQFAQGRQLVETLQRSLLPERLPRHPHVELAARYLPSGLASQIGGDWYDALELDSRRTAVMIGDVVGHGIRAATTMAELRNALRAFAIEGHGPAEALHQLDRVVHTTVGPGMLATVLVVVIDAAAGTVTVAAAGHPPPMLRDADGNVRMLDSDSTPPVGVDTRITPREAQYPIRPGETLLLFTDGLVERRREPLTVGYRRLQDAFSAAPADVEAICDHVLDRTIVEQASRDDVALLVVRLLEQPAPAFELTLTAVPESIPFARHRLRDWLGGNAPGLARMLVAELELVWTEACTNVVRHAYETPDATFVATATLEAGAVCFEISDHGRWSPGGDREGGRGLPLIRQLCDDLEIDRRPTGTTVKMRRVLQADQAESGD